MELTTGELMNFFLFDKFYLFVRQSWAGRYRKAARSSIYFSKLFRPKLSKLS